jgi:hypothetical protein
MKKTMELEIKISPSELAAEFCEMKANEQADFFSEVSRISKEWTAPFCFQLQAITDSQELTNGGREIMSSIGDYSRSDY